MNPLVGFVVHANPGVLCVHLVYNPVLLCLHLADNDATEQLISLLGLFNREEFLGLEGLVEVAELLFSCFLLGRSLIFREIETGAHLLPNFHQRCKGFLDFGSCSLLLDQLQNGDDVDKIFLIVPRAAGGHLELCLVREFELYLFCFPLLMEISWGNIRDGRPNGRHALLTLGVFRPSGGDLRLELMACCQSGVSKRRRLKGLLGRTRRIL
jgi:hypothetical protein